MTLRPTRRTHSGLVAALAFALVLLAAPALARTLPLPDNLVGLNSDAGARMLIEAPARQSYWDLSIQFVTQKTQSYCGVASIVMVLNALGVPAPSTPAYEPYHVYTQDNLLNERTEAVLPEAVIARQGMTLDQLGGLIRVFGVRAEVHHAVDTTLEQFRAVAEQALAAKDQYVIVNYLRRAVGQERGGHISPVAAYDAATDRFLILDVARYKYPPVWVTAADLFAAMNTPDADNDNRTRGFVVIGYDGDKAAD
jgi:hypothetical protein